MRRILFIISLLTLAISMALPQLSQAAPKKVYPVDSDAPAELHPTHANSEWARTHKAGIQLPTTKRKKIELPDEFPGQGDRGNSITKEYVLGRNGMQVTANSELFQIPYQYFPIGRNDLLIYSPAARPYGTACVEAVTAHWRIMLPTPEPNTHHWSSFWNHCPAAGPTGWIAGSGEWTDEPAWRAKYIFNDPSNGPVYTPRVSSTSVNCSRGELWNYSTGVWDIKTPIMCGTPSFGSTSTGWIMWESFGFMDTTNCYPTAVPLIRAYTEKIYNSSTNTWVNVNKPADGLEISHGKCWSNGQYGPAWSWPASPSTTVWQWAAHTPYQARLKIVDNTVPSTVYCYTTPSCPDINLKNNHHYTITLDDWYSQVGGYNSYIYLKVYMPAGGAAWTGRTFAESFISPCTAGMITRINSGDQWSDTGQSVPFGTHCFTSVSMSGTAHTFTGSAWRIEGTVRVNGIDRSLFQYYNVIP